MGSETFACSEFIRLPQPQTQYEVWENQSEAIGNKLRALHYTFTHNNHTRLRQTASPRVDWDCGEHWLGQADSVWYLRRSRSSIPQYSYTHTFTELSKSLRPYAVMLCACFVFKRANPYSTWRALSGAGPEHGQSMRYGSVGQSSKIYVYASWALCVAWVTPPLSSHLFVPPRSRPVQWDYDLVEYVSLLRTTERMQHRHFLLALSVLGRTLRAAILMKW